MSASGQNIINHNAKDCDCHYFNDFYLDKEKWKSSIHVLSLSSRCYEHEFRFASV